MRGCDRLDSRAARSAVLAAAAAASRPPAAGPTARARHDRDAWVGAIEAAKAIAWQSQEEGEFKQLQLDSLKASSEREVRAAPAAICGRRATVAPPAASPTIGSRRLHSQGFPEGAGNAPAASASGFGGARRSPKAKPTVQPFDVELRDAKGRSELRHQAHKKDSCCAIS